MPGAVIPVARPEPIRQTLSWGEVDWMVETAVSKMRARQYRPKLIIPIGGGGIIPAAIMAYRYYKKDRIPIELFDPVYAQSYDHDNHQHELKVLWPTDIDLPYLNSRDTLVVDDIVDTGKTWRAIQKVLPNAVFFSLVTKIVGQPHHYSILDTENKWWDFPWEKTPPQPKKEP